MKTVPADIASYVQALLTLGEACHAVQDIEKDLTAVTDLISGNPEIRRFIADTNIRMEGKYTAFEEILQGKIHPVLLHFLLILLSQDKLNKLDEVAELFHQKVSIKERKVAGELISRHPVSSEQLAAIEHEVSRILNKDVSLGVRQNPDMLGGFWIRVGDFVLDGTLDGQLEDIRKNLLS